MLKHFATMNVRVLSAFEVLGSASRAAAATESGRAPDVRDLERLGIDAVAFAAIRRD